MAKKKINTGKSNRKKKSKGNITEFHRPGKKNSGKKTAKLRRRKKADYYFDEDYEDDFDEKYNGRYEDDLLLVGGSRPSKAKAPKPAEELQEEPEYFQRRPNLAKPLIALAVLLLIAGIGYYIAVTYEIRTVYVDGNNHYTDDEIAERVMNGRFGHNSLYLNFRYRHKQIENIPFISALEVDIVTPDTVRITVYEKSLAGYVKYLGKNMYFDKEGTVVESSEVVTAGVPEVRGLKFEHVVMYEQLPVGNAAVFAEVLDITQSLDKYQLKADRIYFDPSFKVTLYFDDVRVELGDNSSIDEKFARIATILPELQGKAGVLKMESYTSDSASVTFQADRIGEKPDSEAELSADEAAEEVPGDASDKTDENNSPENP